MFSRLYARGERSGRSQLEDYLTEAFASVFDRLGGEERRSLFHALMEGAARAKFDAAFPDLQQAALVTQVTLDATGDRKRPDMVLRLGGRDVLVIEAKLGAAIARHVDCDAQATDGGQVVTRSQLDTYAIWIAGRNRGLADGWPGALVLLTAWTAPPDGFPQVEPNSVLESVRTWSQVANWIVAYAKSPDLVSHALATDLLSFLKEKNLLERHFNARDLAALTHYAGADDAFKHTVRTAMRAVAKAYPRLGAFKDYSVGVDSSIGTYQSWIYLNARLQHLNSKFWIGLGVCPEPGAAFDEDFVEAAKEPFFLIYFGDENLKQKPQERVTALPNGWIEMRKRSALIATKPVREFTADPERRADDLAVWACERVGLLTKVMKDHS